METQQIVHYSTFNRVKIFLQAQSTMIGDLLFITLPHVCLDLRLAL